jgi:hypothetical protein
LNDIFCFLTYPRSLREGDVRTLVAPYLNRALAVFFLASIFCIIDGLRAPILWTCSILNAACRMASQFKRISQSFHRATLIQRPGRLMQGTLSGRSLSLANAARGPCTVPCMTATVETRTETFAN